MATGNVLSAQINVTLPASSVQAFEKTAAATTKATAALQKLPQTANTATSAMINLGRVVQDAPFGFLGIANNLNPLLESFQRLKAESGSAGSALRALGGSLMGAGGLGFALSIASSLLIVFGGNLFGVNKAAKETEEELTFVAKATKEVREELDTASKSTVSHTERLSELRTVLVDTSNNYLDLANSIVKQGLAQFLFTQKQGTVEKILTDVMEKRLALQKRINATPIIKEFGAEDPKGIDKRLAGLEEIRKAGIGLDENEKKLFDINNLARSLGLSFEPFVRKIKEGKKELDDFEPKFDLKNRGQIQAQFQKIFDNIQGFVIPEFHIKPKDSDKILENLKKEVSKTPMILPIPIDPKIILNAEKVTQQAALISRAVEGIIVDGLSGIGEAIGESLVGGDFQKGIKSFLGAIAGGISALGKQLIAFAVAQKLAIEAAKKFNPILTAAAGLALIVIGSAMRKAINGSGNSGFAEGGYTGAGGKYQPAGVVHKGEFVIPAYAVNRLGLGYLNNLAFGRGVRGYADGGFVTGGLTGGGSVNVSGEFILRRDVLIAAIKQGEMSQRRLT